MSEEQKQQAEKISAEINKLTPEMREKALIFMQGMAAMVLLKDMFPGRAAIGITECQAALGIDRRTLLADRRFPARHIGNKYTVSLTELARWMVQR